ncbi:hypothetical protein [Frigidibacter oleivorans]|uniref:hypothetical protein n=1 Tax=Frigidibacter oleivorans TaxID=2487129 RepID=UPI000F8D9CEF|nr:hypothetical protein [Frigidibacter oleivorans]
MTQVPTARSVLSTAARALGKVDHWGTRGLTMLSQDEIEAMALALVLLGLPAIPPGAKAPEA